MKKKIQISASDLASILAIWAVAYLGCKNIVAYVLETHLPQYFSELLKPDSPTFGIATPVQHCIIATVIISSLLFFFYDISIKKINDAESFITKRLGNIHIKEILIVIIVLFIMLIKVLFDKDYSPFIFLFLFIYTYTSDKFLFAAKIALVPALILIIFSFLLQEKTKHKESYIISTTCDGLKDLKVISAIRVGNFVEVKTDTETFLINMNTITRIQPIKNSPDEAAKTPQPTEQK